MAVTGAGLIYYYQVEKERKQKEGELVLGLTLHLAMPAAQKTYDK